MSRHTCLRIFASVAAVVASAPGSAQLRMQVLPFESVTLTTQQVLLGETQGKPVTLAGELRLPHWGTDKLPGVILVHGIWGISQNHDEWARALNEWGYAAFIVDSLSGRGIAPASREDALLSGLARMVDAYRALAFLARHPRIDPDRIAVMGFSLGGAASVFSSSERFRKVHGPAGIQFAAHIGVYAICTTRYREDARVGARPIRLFHGIADDWVPVEPCRALVADMKKAGADAALTEFAGAFHAYDSSNLKERMALPQVMTIRKCALTEGEGGQVVNAKTGQVFGPADPCIEQGVSIQYDEAATRGTREGVKAVLASALGPKPPVGGPSATRGGTSDNAASR